MIQENQIKKTDWKEVVTFYLIACIFSWLFRMLPDISPTINSSIPPAIRNLGVMWRPGVAAIISFTIFRKTHVRTITFTGTSISKSLACYLLPYGIWIAISLFNPGETSIKLSFFLPLIPFGFLMILGEELGWRGFLQDSLQSLKEWKKWVILGLLWELWHFERGIANLDWPQVILRKSSFIIATIILSL